MATPKLETPDDWTEVLTTRVSPHAKEVLRSKLQSLQGVSQATYLRQLLYKELGIIPPPKPPRKK